MEAKFLETFPSLKKDDAPIDKDLHAGFKFHSHRKPLLMLMRGKVENQPDGQELKPGVGLEGLKVQLQGEEGEKLNPPKDEEKPQDEEKGKEEEEEYKDYMRSFPSEGIVSKVMWIVSLPLMAPMWITIPDPQDEKKKEVVSHCFHREHPVYKKPFLLHGMVGHRDWGGPQHQ